MSIEISGLVCRYGDTRAINDIDITIEDGEFLALLGPSGSGKTTLLRVLAGLEAAEAGTIRIGNEDTIPVPPNKRGIGFVFQHYALFRHMTVARNIAFGLDIRPKSGRPSRVEIKRRVDELLELVQLPGYGHRYPAQLSGGQRQRIALARALAVEPRILLLDEPFGALDTKVRTELRVWLKSLHRRLGITAVFVTHDQTEAMELSDRIVVMRAGKIEQIGRPAQVYAAPINSFVYSFLGDAHYLDCTTTGNRAVTADGVEIADHVGMTDGPAKAWFRPHDVEIFTDPCVAALEGAILDLTTLGPRGRVAFDYQGRILTAELPHTTIANASLAVGGKLRWRPAICQLFRD